jgi:hypothetical protein
MHFARLENAQLPSFQPEPSQVRQGFFDLVDKMTTNLYRRAQDPNDPRVDKSFVYKTFGEIPDAQKYNMDEIGNDSNKGRKKVVAGIPIPTPRFHALVEI